MSASDDAPRLECYSRPGRGRALRCSVQGFLDTLSDDFITLADATLPTPDLAAIASVGAPTRAAEGLERAAELEARRRRLLRGLVEDDG